MKKFLAMLVLAMFAVSAAVQAQAPNAFNYQGVARNSFGTVINNKTIGIRFSIRDLSAAGTVVYSERHTVNTDQYGVFGLTVGGGTVISGTMAGVPWGVGNKFLQVEMDPNGGTSFINMGTVQLNSVPFSILAGGAPPIGPAGGELTGTYPNPLIRLPLVKTQADAGPLVDITNSGAGASYSGTNTGTGPAGVFTVNNAASTADALRAVTNGTGASWAIRATSTGTNGSGLFISNNPTATNNNLQSNTNGLGRAGLFNLNNAASTANALEANNNGTGTAIVGNQTNTTGTGAGVSGTSASTSGNAAAVVGTISSTTPGGFSAGVRGINNGTGGLGIGVWGSQAGSGWGVYGTADGGIGVNGSANSGIGVNGTSNTGTGGRFTTTSGLALFTTGALRLQGIGEAANRILTSDAAGNATWQTAAAVGVVTGSGTLNFLPKWTPSGTNLGNSLLFDNGTSMGVGTTTPSHRLDVTHSGSTGIGVNSTSGFSVVDINAQSGDAALRFAKAGVNQWNIRNRPADDYLEIFELGGGGSRMVIQDGTGNVGIGETTSPSYRLDVLHGGSTGARIRSSASFSVVDIDASSGDAALRFAKAGVNQWNIRNRPADDYLEIFELGGGGSRMVIQDGTGNVGIGATVSPSYKLDVEHGGSTGIRSKSTGSFSVVDIDAFSGDAALRFANNGVNQWNMRNRPGDDYLEIFELGGGGSRMVIQDGTGNVGIGETTSPSYRLDVLHGGATGARVRSSSTFSIIDIDAANGDAALRFAKAGVNQWNTRNRPADDYYEIFELGGGGSRMVIQDGTGNVGIGETTNPTYRLDVLHGGATGIRSRSSATFSLMDIDAANGDAALRFARAGVNQWNIRNNPGTDDLQIFELGGGGERMRIENTTGRVVVDGDLHVAGTLSKAAGAFKIDHPLDPANKYLWHSFVESPDMMNIYNGNITTDASGKAVVQLPDYFEALNMEFRYQLTVMGQFAQAIVSKKISGNKFELMTDKPNVEVSWMVTGVRHDAVANKNRIPNAVEKEAANKGKYLNPEAFNLPKSKAIGYTVESGASSLDDINPVLKSVKAAPATSGGSLDQGPIVPPTTKAADRSGSVGDAKPVVVEKKVLPIDGSVKPQEPKKEETKAPVKKEEKGGSTDQ